jgi:hypothetical protein
LKLSLLLLESYFLGRFDDVAFNVQASVLSERKRAVQALCNDVVSAFEASDLQAYPYRYRLLTSHLTLEAVAAPPRVVFSGPI